MKKQIKPFLFPARTKRAINAKASDFANKALQNHKPDGSKNLSEFYCGCVHGIATVCNILNLSSQEINSIMEKINKL